MHAGMLALLGPIGLPELVIILFILVLVFGAKRLSGLGRGMGQAIRGFKDEMQTDDDAEPAPKAKAEAD
ncbi:MAG: twin-arginine translocase TatA/TatE family subunit [Acidobacteria bacterium]|nr:twin-arginine translocase TatA/TatE family subunit [Acidobacteriota bacterium]MCY4075927.1 twin-arginine translocase TatA/TatE family subunit [Acidobacteriota bacterium]